MTKDEIIAMAKEAGFNWPEILTTTIEERLERFYNLAYTKGVQDERKAIAQMENHMTTQQTEALQLEQVIKERDEALLRQALEALKAENEMLREALKDAEVKQGEVK